jgi:hypothetical protein
MSFSNQQRKFIHDLANSISIVEMCLSSSLRDIKDVHPEMTETLKRLEKGVEYSKKTVQGLKDFRQFIIESEK